MKLNDLTHLCLMVTSIQIDKFLFKLLIICMPSSLTQTEMCRDVQCTHMYIAECKTLAGVNTIES